MRSDYKLDLSVGYTHSLINTLRELIGIAFTNKATLILKLESKQVEVKEPDITVATSATLDSTSFTMLKGYVTLANITARALKCRSIEFREFFILRYGLAYGEGVLHLCENVTEEFLRANIDELPYYTYSEQRIMRGVENGVTFSTDVIVTHEIQLGEPRQRNLPIVYPVVIVGQNIAFNQSIPTEHIVINHATDDPLHAPVIASHIFVDSTGMMDITHGEASDHTGERDGVEYDIGILGVRAK